jgi:hypothetical protein
MPYAYAFVINEEEEIDTMSLDICLKTVRWVQSFLRAEFGRHDGDIHAAALGRGMDALRGLNARDGARALLRRYYRMACDECRRNEEWHDSLKRA